MNCPFLNCDERLQMQGGQLLINGEPVTHGFCIEHGLIRFVLKGKDSTMHDPDKITYVYRWGNNEKRKTMKGRACIVLCRGTKNSCMIEFCDNGQREIISRNALKKKK